MLDGLIVIIKMAVILIAFVTAVAYATLAERKFSAFFQNRIGPNRFGPRGLLQPLADLIKFLFKEDFMPEQAKPLMFRLAPVLTVIPVLMILSVIPFGDQIAIAGKAISLSIADINVAVLFVFGLSSLGVYGVILGGWSSGNKYSLRGGLRASAQMISYEIPLSLSIVGLIMVTGTFSLKEMVAYQIAHGWNFWVQPFGFLLFFVAGMAEIARMPFDLPEAEAELVGGYHTEYSGLRFAIFQMAEYGHMILTSLILATLFFGGYHFPGMNLVSSPLLQGLLQVGTLLFKAFLFVFLFMWIRWTIPRFRYDQLMNLGWKVLIPLTLINIFVTGVLILV